MSRLLVAIVSATALIACGGGQGVVTVAIDPPTAQVQQGQTARFTANVTGTTNKTLLWAATGGQLIAKDMGATFVALEAGSFEVTATSQANPAVVATATILVTPVPGQARVRFVTDGSVVVAGAGATKRLEVEVLDESGAVVDTGQVSYQAVNRHRGGWHGPSPDLLRSQAADPDRAELGDVQHS